MGLCSTEEGQELCSRRYPLQSSLAFIRLTCVMYCSSKCHYEMPLGRHLPWHHSPSQWRSPSHAHKISRHCSLLSREGGSGEHYTRTNVSYIHTTKPRRQAVGVWGPILSQSLASSVCHIARRKTAVIVCSDATTTKVGDTSHLQLKKPVTLIASVFRGFALGTHSMGSYRHASKPYRLLFQT